MEAMHLRGRGLYRFDADESPATYITNYVITAVCVLGLVAHFATKRPDWKQTPAAIALSVHLGGYAVVMLIGGLGHHVWKHNRCPGTEMPANVSVPCPNGPDNEPVISAYLFFLGPCEFQLLTMAIALSGLADRCKLSFGLKSPLVIGINVLGLGLGILGCALGHGGFLILGALLLALYLLLAIACGVGLVVGGGQTAARLLVVAGSLCAIVGGVVQVLLTGACGSSAYMADGGTSCPFGGNGIVGINHNFVYHVFEIVSKLCLVVALRFLGRGEHAQNTALDTTRVAPAPAAHAAAKYDT